MNDKSGAPSHMNKAAFFGLLCALALFPDLASAEASGECGGDFDHSHGSWNALVKQHVTGKSVSYGALRSSGRQKLTSYLGTLEGVCRSQYDSWNQNQKLAFWINAYNAYTASLILDNYPTPSIMKIGGQGAAFKRRFVPLGHLRSKGAKASKISLNDVENGIIRKQFREPRIHFALNCASKSCPPLRAEAYVATSLSRQLEAQTRAFARDTSANRYDAKTHTLFLSRIFEWYGEDFRRGKNTVQSFVGGYLGGAAADAIKAKAPRVKYLEYDWSLNGR